MMGFFGDKSADVARALSIIFSDGPDLGLNLNLKKCELISSKPLPHDQSALFSSDIIRMVENFENVPVGNAKYCAEYVKKKCSSSAFRAIDAISAIDDPQVALMLLRLCSSFCKIVHYLRSVPPFFIKVIQGSFSLIRRFRVV